MDDFFTPEAVHVKWHHNNHWHRFAVPSSGLNFNCFIEFLKSVEPDFDGRIDYVDDEGDLIRISSTSSIDELVRIAVLMRLKVIYLHSGDETIA